MHAAPHLSRVTARFPSSPHRAARLLVIVVAVALIPGAASAFFHHNFIPPDPSLTMVCDKGRIPPGYQYENLRAARVCPKPGEAYPGDLVAFDAKDFPSDFPAKPANVVRLYTLRDGEWGASNYHGSRSTGSGNFSFLTTIPGHLKPGTYAFILRVIDTCSACNLERPYVNGQCPPAECIQKVRQNFIQAVYDIRILDPKGRPGFHPGAGPFGFECSWTESEWNASREQYDHATKTSATDCPSGARFHLRAGPFPLAFRDEFLTFYLRRGAPDASGHCPDGAMAGLGGNGGRHCYYHQYSPYAGRVCTPTPYVKSNCPNDRGAAVLCDGPDRPHSPGVKTNCRVDASNNLTAPPGAYELVIRNRWPSTAIDSVQAWEVAGQTITITAPVKDPAPTYQQKQFTVSILRDELKLDSPLVPQYVERGQLIAGTLFSLPIRWNPPTGESFKFPAHTMAIVLDANVRGDGGVVIAEGRVGLNTSSWEPVNQLTWHNLKLPVDTTPGRHQLTVRCINCDERLTIADPAIGNRGRPVAYAPASIAVEVVDPANLSLPSVRVQPATAGPGKTITITGVHYPPKAIVTTVELTGRSGSRPLLTTYRRPPDDQYTLPVEGRPVTEWKPTIDLPVGSDGRFTITMTLPPTVGDLVLGRGEIRATVAARAGDWMFTKDAKVTIDASACPIIEKHATLTFVSDRDGATVSPGKPIDYGRGDGTRVEGKGFHCRSPLKTITATWRSRGKTFGPVTIPTVSKTPTPGVPFTSYGVQETAHDGTIGGGFARLIFSPNGLFWRGNYLDVDHALVTIADAGGRTSAPARLDLTLPYRAVLDPTWLRRERKGDAAVKAGDWVKVHLNGFPTGHRVHVQHLNWELGEEPIGDKNQSWNEALVDRMVTAGRRLFIERNPDVVDLEIPKETPPGVQTFIFVDTTEGGARPDFLGSSSGLWHSRGRTFLTIDVAAGKTPPPEEEKKLPSENPKRPPPKPPTPEPPTLKPPEPEVRYCDPNLPKIWQEGCVSRDKLTPAPDPKKETACDPNLPSFFVGACPPKEIPWQPPKPPTPEPQPEPTPAPTPGVTYCDPNIPKIWQGDCINRTPTETPKPESGAPARCISTIPKFSQPGCVEAARPGTSWLRSIASVWGDLLLGAVSTPTLADEPTARRWTPKILAGTYRCWNFNVGGGGGVCRNPPLELRTNGTYVMSKERGSYRIRGEKLTLSKSTFRGMGTISADGMQIRFQYKYRGLDHTVTYLRTTNVDLDGQGLAMLALTIRYPKESDWLDWVSAIELEETSGADRTVYTALGNTMDREHLTAYYKKGVPSGRMYRVYVSTGTDRVLAGTVNLGDARGEVKRTIDALPLPNTAGNAGPSGDPGIEPAAPPTTQGARTRPPTAAPTTIPSIPTIPTTMPSAPSVPRVPCDPNIPRYSQVGCVDPNDPAPTADRPNGLVEVNIPTGLTNVPVVGNPARIPSGNLSEGTPPLIAPLPEGPTWTPPPNAETSSTPSGTTPSRTPTTPTPRKNTGDPWRDTYENEDTPIRNWYREHPGAVMGPPLLRYNLPSGIF